MLNLLYRRSQAEMRKYEKLFTSKTLDELYTDKFCPKKGYEINTTVKNARTGEPVNAKVTYMFEEDGKETYWRWISTVCLTDSALN